MTNQKTADTLRVSLRAVEKWRQGVRQVPGPVVAILEMLATASSDTPTSGRVS